MNDVERVQELVVCVDTLPQGNKEMLTMLLRQVEVTTRMLFGPSSPHLTHLSYIRFSPNVSPSSDEVKTRVWNSGASELSAVLHAMLTELEMSDPSQRSSGIAVSEGAPQYSRRVFVVHGQDGEMKQAVARMLERLDFEPIILHEQPDGGRTIFQKFTDYTDVGFAVVLLSPDDLGCLSDEFPDKARPRARQNVVLELGYFLGKLPRGRVVPLIRKEEDYELPSDYIGVAYKPYDNDDGWKMKLVQELKYCGYEVDADKLV